MTTENPILVLLHPVLPSIPTTWFLVEGSFGSISLCFTPINDYQFFRVYTPKSPGRSSFCLLKFPETEASPRIHHFWINHDQKNIAKHCKTTSTSCLAEAFLKSPYNIIDILAFLPLPLRIAVGVPTMPTMEQSPVAHFTLVPGWWFQMLFFYHLVI